MFESKWFWLGAVIGLAWILFSRCERDAARLGIGISAGVGPGNRVGPLDSLSTILQAPQPCCDDCHQTASPPSPGITPLGTPIAGRGGPSGYGTRPGFGNSFSVTAAYLAQLRGGLGGVN